MIRWHARDPVPRPTPASYIVGEPQVFETDDSGNDQEVAELWAAAWWDNDATGYSEALQAGRIMVEVKRADEGEEGWELFEVETDFEPSFTAYREERPR